MITWTGKWLKGRASTVSITRVLAYAQIPIASMLLFQIPCLCLFGLAVFKSNTNFIQSEALGIFVSTIWYLLISVMGIWSFVIGVIGLSELQNFSLWRSFLKYILPFLIIMSIIVIPIGLLTWIAFSE